ncbi:MAG: PQQ-binding-like beta-propeller repeat protein, partial [Pirellulales bacterium]
QRRGKAPASAGPVGSVACVRVEGAVYGLDVATGKLLWRRYVGFSTNAWPMVVGSDVLVTDARQRELLRLNATTGNLVWRQTIGEPFGEPLVVGPRAFLAAKSGRLYVVDLDSGARAGYMQFPQPLSTPPTADRRQQRLYLTGDQFSLYSVSLADLTCIGSYYLGHEAASIQIAPAQLLNKLAILENNGVETSRLHIMSLDDRGAVAGQETDRRLAGLSASPLLVEGRRLIVITDRGRFDVYEIGAGKGDEALAPVATRDATDRQSVVRYVAVANGNLWVGDTQLTKYAILTTGNQLRVESIQNNFAGDAFDHPLELFGDTLIHVRRPKRRAGVTVAATDMKQGRTLWETDLAVPPAAAPVVDSSGRALAVANANGYVFRFDDAAIRSRVQDEPLAARSMPPTVKPLTGGADLGDGRAAFFTPDSEQLLLYDPSASDGAAHWIELPSPLTCAATPFNKGLLAPLKIGQVFYLNPADGKQLAAPFQPKLEPRTTVEYRAAGVGAAADRRFVITDGQENIYLVELVDQPQPHLESVSEGKVSPMRIVSPVAVLGETAVAAADGGHLVRYKLPALEASGEADLPGDAVWGPFRVGEQALVATADEQLVAISPAGEIAWKAKLEHGELAGPPLEAEGGFLLAYRKGIVERRSMADGSPAAQHDLEHPLATGPVRFMQRLVLTADDGTLLVVEQP